MLFQEDEPNMDSMEMETTPNSNGSSDNFSNENEPDDDSLLQPKRIKMEHESSTVEERTSLDSTNGIHLNQEEDIHKNGEVDELESSGEFNPKIVSVETADTGEGSTEEPGIFLSLLEKEVQSLECLLVKKELEWNAILRLKKLKELLLEQLRREEDISSYTNQPEGPDVKTLLKECILEKNNMKKIDSEMNTFTSNITNEISKVELEISERSGRKYRQIVQKDDPLNLEHRNASKALQKLCEKNTAAASIIDTKQGPKGPIVQVTSLIADYRAKRKNEAAAASSRKQRVTKPNVSTSQISYSDVLVSLAKISSSENKSGSITSDVSNTNVNSSTPPKGNSRSGGQNKSNITLAKLLSASGTTPTTGPRGEEPKSTGDDYKSRHLNSSSGLESNISLSNLLATNKSRNEQPVKPDSIPICQGCSTNQAQFVCAGCGNQWYCSRECQVEAWDDHAESCSG